MKLQVKVCNVTKRFRKQIVFDLLNYTFTNSKYHFIIGENGSGKTTLLKCMLGLTTYQGTIESNITTFAYAPAQIALPDYVTMAEFLTLLGEVKQFSASTLEKKLGYYVRLFALEPHYQKMIHHLSFGTKQKMVLIQCLMSEAEGYIFDEPLQGLDSASQQIFMAELKRLKQQGKLIIIATHKPNQYHLRNRTCLCMGEF